jgi:1-deoxy-D-xylulose-5-phosphate reductoisomerase
VGRAIVILGSTGSIGQQALEVARALPDDLRVVGIAAGQNLDLLGEQVRAWSPPYVSAPTLTPGTTWRGAQVLSLSQMAAIPEAERVLVSTVGATGLLPTLAALRSGKSVALANKEVLVMAGALIVDEAREHDAELLPVDSEHSAIWQCLAGDCVIATGAVDGPVRRIILTASGGAFRDLPLADLDRVAPEQALAHPTWVMGPKVTVDSATLMNKGFEVIEAHWLFGLPYDQIDVVLHRESVVHSLVEFIDGSFKAELGPRDMRLPVQHALTYPERRAGAWPALRLEDIGKISFGPLDRARYPCFELALAAARAGGTAPTVLSAADDVAVRQFLDRQIPFTGIAEQVDRALQAHAPVARPSFEEIVEADAWARDYLLRSPSRGRPFA